MRSGTLKPLNVATSHLLTDVQEIWPLPRHRESISLSIQCFSKKEKMSLARMTGMLILMSMWKKNKNGWEKLMLTGNDDKWNEDFPNMMSTWRKFWISGK